MGFVRSKEDDVLRISTSIFVSNFPDQFSAKDLFNTCKQYGHVIDSFIPLKRTKDGKRFGFVRFINIFSVKRLVEEWFGWKLRVSHLNFGMIRHSNELLQNGDLYWRLMRNQEGIQSDHEINMVNEESDVEEILETVFDAPEGKHANSSEDLFGLNPLLNREKVDKNPKVKEVESSLKHPPGFTPNEIDKGDFPDGEYVNMGDNYSSVNMADDKEKPISVSKVADSMGSCRLKKSGVPHSGGSILSLMEEVVKVGQTMGYNMDGCVKDITEIIKSQGEIGVNR
nr:nucleotide-binding alpha-beta plait domain-containing protein [Tanacetum cinerariifolium]